MPRWLLSRSLLKEFVMFGFSGPTQYDLRFSLLGIPVFVNPMFWAMSAFMGWNVVTTPGLGPICLLIWIASIFVSILIHELGHAIFAKAFGWPPQIFLYHMGGLAVYQPYSGHTTGKNIAISFAGPAAGFLFFGLIKVAEFVLVHLQFIPGSTGFFFMPYDQFLFEFNQAMQVVPIANQTERYTIFTLETLGYINFFWGLVNLLPVLPLDGGRICEAVCDQLNKHKGKQWAAIIGMVFAALAALYFFQGRQKFAGYFFAYLCYVNFTSFQRAKQGYW